MVYSILCRRYMVEFLHTVFVNENIQHTVYNNDLQLIRLYSRLYIIYYIIETVLICAAFVFIQFFQSCNKTYSQVTQLFWVRYRHWHWFVTFRATYSYLIALHALCFVNPLVLLPCTQMR